MIPAILWREKNETITAYAMLKSAQIWNIGCKVKSMSVVKIRKK